MLLEVNLIEFVLTVRLFNDCFRYYVLDKSKTLNENLQGKVVIEYPTLIVVLSDKLHQYRLVGQGESMTSVILPFKT